MHTSNSFLTLTYDNEHLPYAGQLVKKHVQDFMKRLRITLERRYEKRVRYYYVGEYGDTTRRPHYHICLFGHDFIEDRVPYRRTPKGHLLYNSPILTSCWPFGFSNIGEFNFESAAYVARYCLKKQTGRKDPEIEEVYCDLQTGEVVLREPEFGQPSTNPGIGATWYEKFGADIRRTDFAVMRGKRMLPPRYFDKLTEKHFPEEFEDIKAHRALQSTEIDSSFSHALELRRAGRAREQIQRSAHLVKKGL